MRISIAHVLMLFIVLALCFALLQSNPIAAYILCTVVLGPIAAHATYPRWSSVILGLISSVIWTPVFALTTAAIIFVSLYEIALYPTKRVTVNPDYIDDACFGVMLVVILTSLIAGIVGGRIAKY